MFLNFQKLQVYWITYQQLIITLNSGSKKIVKEIISFNLLTLDETDGLFRVDESIVQGLNIIPLHWRSQKFW